MEKPETKFKYRVLAALRALPNSYWEKIQQVSIRGTPDILGCCNGYYIALELKASEDDDADELQKYKLRKISDAGGFALVVCPETFDEILKLLQGLSIGAIQIKYVKEQIKETMQ